MFPMISSCIHELVDVCLRISDAARRLILIDGEMNNELISMVPLMNIDCYSSVIMFNGCAARYSDSFY